MALAVKAAEKEEAEVPVARGRDGLAAAEEGMVVVELVAEGVVVVASAAVATEVEAEAVVVQEEAAMGMADWEREEEEAAEAGPAAAA